MELALPNLFEQLLGKDENAWPRQASLLVAAHRGNVRRLKEIAKDLDDGDQMGIETTVAITTFHGMNALHAAAGLGNLSVYRYLVEEANMNVNEPDTSPSAKTPLEHAVTCGDLPAVRYLLNHGADLHQKSQCNNGVLFVAAKKGLYDIAKLLLSRGAIVDGKLESPQVHESTVEYRANPGKVVPASCPVTPLDAAICASSLPCVELLIEAGANLKGALARAATKGFTKAVKCLLKAGANPNHPDKYGRLPIELAAVYGTRDDVKLLFPSTSPIPTVANWTVEGIIAHANLESKQLKRDPNTLSDEEIEKELKAMLLKDECVFFSNWSALKKRLFYMSTLVELPHLKQIVDYASENVMNSVLFDTTNEKKAQASYLRAINQYRTWHLAGSDLIYEVGPRGRKVCVTRKDQTFVFWYRYKNDDVGLVIDGQTAWVEGFLRRTHVGGGVFTYDHAIQFSNPVTQTKSTSNRTEEESGQQMYIIADDIEVADCDGSYGRVVSKIKLSLPLLQNFISCIAHHDRRQSFHRLCHDVSDMLILYSTEAGKNYWIFQYTMKSLSERLVGPISVPPCLDGTVTNHRQASTSILETLSYIINKSAKNEQEADNKKDKASKKEDESARSAEDDDDDDAQVEEDEDEDEEDGDAAAAEEEEEEDEDEKEEEDEDDDDDEEDGDEDTEDEAVAAAEDEDEDDEEDEDEKEEEDEDDDDNEEDGDEDKEDEAIAAAAEDEYKDKDKKDAAADEGKDEDEKKDESSEEYKIVTGTPLRKLCQCLDVYIILRRKKLVRTKFIVKDMELGYISQGMDEVVRECCVSEEDFEKKLEKGTFFTLKEHSGFNRYRSSRSQLWSMPPVPCTIRPRPFTGKPNTKMKWYFPDGPETD